MVSSNGDRLHIGVFGRSNVGKSSLVNAIAGQRVAIVSSVKGTTTDPIYKPVELNGIGAVRLIDTAGIDDDTELGAERIQSTLNTLDSVDAAILVIGEGCGRDGYEQEKRVIERFINNDIPFIVAYNTFNPELCDIDTRCVNEFESIIVTRCDKRLYNGIVAVNAVKVFGVEVLLNKLQRFKKPKRRLTEGFISPHDRVVLVMPQDKSAPAGRLILPQATVIREILDIGAVGVVCTEENLENTLELLQYSVDLVITDSQAFKTVDKIVPDNIPLTGFSVLLAAEKGDLNAFTEGAEAMDSLNERSRVLIAEACSHIPQNEDIGRVKIPALLYSRYGVTDITNVGGNDFPTDLTEYDLVIHCGACMFNKRLVMNRINRAAASGTPITNYGIAIAKMNGVLDRIKIK